MLVNLTPHPINIIVDGVTITLQSSGIARCAENIECAGIVDGVPVIRKTLGDVTGLPEQEDGVFYIVSLAVAMAARRPDVLAIGESIRDEKGNIIGCKSLARV